MIEIIATSKLFGNDELHIPKAVKESFDFEFDKDTRFEWKVVDNEIIIKPRKKVTLDDVVGMITEEDELDHEDWDIDKAVYLNE